MNGSLGSTGGSGGTSCGWTTGPGLGHGTRRRMRQAIECFVLPVNSWSFAFPGETVFWSLPHVPVPGHANVDKRWVPGGWPSRKGGIPVNGGRRVSPAAMLLALALSPIYPASLSAQEGGHHPNHAGLFLGVTRVEGHSSFTIGADYERTLPVAHERLAIGGLIDVATGREPKHVIVAGTLSFRPVEPLKLLVGPGIEFSHGKSEALFRAGAAFDVLKAEALTISPGVYFDFVGGHTATVFGVTFGKGF